MIQGSEILRAARSAQEETAEILRSLIRIPSFSGDEGRVVEAIRGLMEGAGFDPVVVDPFGNVMGRIGRGKRVLAFDAHVDTVGVGDPRLWRVDPFGGEMTGGIIYGRGASDQKGGMAALISAGALIRRLDLAGDASVWVVGSVLEEDCDGLCWHYILKEGLLTPEVVVLTEPTDLKVSRGQRGRMEIEITTRGISCHGSAPERGINAIYRMRSILSGVEKLNERLPRDPFLGPGSVAVSEIRSTSPSLCAVSDSCTIHLDRRLTYGEADGEALREIAEILRVAEEEEPDAIRRAGPVEVTVPEFRRPSHTGLLVPMRQYYPAWCLPQSHPFVQTALQAREMVLGEAGVPGKWHFSTNGVATMGLHGVPTIGFGPAREVHAHTPEDQCPVSDLGAAVAFYAAFAALFGASPEPGIEKRR